MAATIETDQLPTVEVPIEKPTKRKPRNKANKLRDAVDVGRSVLRFLKDEEPTVYYADKLFTFNGLHYESAPKNRMGQLVHRATEQLGGKSTTAFWNAVETWVRDELPRVDSVDADWLPLQNTFLNAVTLETEPNSSDRFFPYVLPYEYDPGAAAPRFETYIDEIMRGDDELVQSLLEFMGYTLTADTSLDKILGAIGPEGTGKSTFFELFQEMVGRPNVSRVPLEILADRFQQTELVGKLLNISDDVSTVSGRRLDGMLKRLGSGAGMQIDVKFRDPRTWYPTVKLAFNANDMPHFRSISGLNRRFLFIPFTFAPVKKNPNLLNELVQELPGILNLALAARARLYERGEFLKPAASTPLMEDFRTTASSPYEFVQEHFEVAPGSVVLLSAVYEEYSAWCRENGRERMSQQRFSKEIQHIGDVTVVKVKQRKTGLRDKRVVIGLRTDLDGVMVNGNDAVDILAAAKTRYDA